MANTRKRAAKGPPRTPNIQLIQPASLAMLNRSTEDYTAVLRYWADPSNQARLQQTYDEMMLDARVAQGVQLMKSAVLTLGYDIVSKKGGSEQEDSQLEEIKDFIEEALENIPGATADNLSNLLSCYERGYALVAITYAPMKSAKRKWGIGEFIPLPVGLFKPEADAAGRIKGIVGPRNSEDLPEGTFIYAAWNRIANSPYGLSQLTYAYQAWWNKKELRKLRNLGLDRHGSPFTVMKVPPNTPDEKRREFLNVIKNLQGSGGAVIDDNTMLELLESGSGGAANYQQPLEYENMEILAAITGATLNMDRGGGGSYAQARVHMEMFLYLVDRLARVIEASLNEYLIKPLIELNFGAKAASQIRLSWGKAENKTKELSDLLTTMIPIGVVQPTEPWVREKLELPPAPPEPPAEGAGGMGGFGLPDDMAGGMGGFGGDEGFGGYGAAPEDDDPIWGAYEQGSKANQRAFGRRNS